MRLFISVQLNKVLRNQLLDVQEGMREQGVQGNFTRAANLHITLAFVGEYNDPSEVLEVVRSVDFWPFEISLDGVGAFGDLWWAGVDKGSEELKALAGEIPVKVIGDALASGKMGDAVRGGYMAAMEIV